MADKDYEKHYETLTKLVKPIKVKKAINNNDFDLAYDNFKKIEKYLMSLIYDDSNAYGLNSRNTEEFHTVVQTVKEKGIKHYFPDDPIDHWTTLPDAHQVGFCNFLFNEKKKRLRREAYASKKAA